MVIDYFLFILSNRMVCVYATRVIDCDNKTADANFVLVFEVHCSDKYFFFFIYDFTSP